MCKRRRHVPTQAIGFSWMMLSRLRDKFRGLKATLIEQTSWLHPNGADLKKIVGSGGIRTHASEETGALNQRLRPLGHATP